METLQAGREPATPGKLQQIIGAEAALARCCLLFGVALLTFEVSIRETQRPTSVAVSASIVLVNLADALALGRSRAARMAWRIGLFLCSTACLLRLLWAR